MPNNVRTKTARLEARISPEARDTLARAAEIQGRSLSDFVVSAALDAAQRVIADTEVIRLSREASETLAAALIKPSAPNKALRRAAARHRRLIVPR
jgi:uncharacterized protein (DUF1778 family)